MARQNRLDPIIGRDEEIRRTIQILSRKTKSNPVLLGSPGVGKSAILEGIAQRIVNREVPEVSLERNFMPCQRVFSISSGWSLTLASILGFYPFPPFQSLQSKRLLTLDLASLIAGSGIRGQFEEKFKALIEDIQDAQTKAIEEGEGGVICCE